MPRYVNLPAIADQRGSLVFGETERHIPFTVRRYFVLFGVSGNQSRGDHAHRKLHQFLTCIAGHCHCTVDDGRSRRQFTLDKPAIGLYIPPLCWSIQSGFSRDAVLAVMASEYYDEGDYVRDYAEFLALVGEGKTR